MTLKWGKENFQVQNASSIWYIPCMVLQMRRQVCGQWRRATHPSLVPYLPSPLASHSFPYNTYLHFHVLSYYLILMICWFTYSLFHLDAKTWSIFGLDLGLGMFSYKVNGMPEFSFCLQHQVEGTAESSPQPRSTLTSHCTSLQQLILQGLQRPWFHDVSSSPKTLNLFSTEF